VPVSSFFCSFEPVGRVRDQMWNQVTVGAISGTCHGSARIRREKLQTPRSEGNKISWPAW
jgi:hypothetical protein